MIGCRSHGTEIEGCEFCAKTKKDREMNQVTLIRNWLKIEIQEARLMDFVQTTSMEKAMQLGKERETEIEKIKNRIRNDLLRRGIDAVIIDIGLSEKKRGGSKEKDERDERDAR